MASTGSQDLACIIISTHEARNRTIGSRHAIPRIHSLSEDRRHSLLWSLQSPARHRHLRLKTPASRAEDATAPSPKDWQRVARCLSQCDSGSFVVGRHDDDKLCFIYSLKQLKAT